MQIIIVKCSKPSYWYASYIGHKYNVELYTHERYIVRNNPTLLIDKCDCSNYFITLMERAIDKASNNR